MTKIEMETANLEDLLVLGDDKLIRVVVEFPISDTETTKGAVLVKQLTMHDLDNLKTTQDSIAVAKYILTKCLFTNEREVYTSEMVDSLPIGVVYALSEKIMEISGLNKNENLDKKLMDF